MAAFHAVREGAIAVCLGMASLSCVVGVGGMWRMRTPTQALHYSGFPGTIGIAALLAAVILQTGNSIASWNTGLIALLLLAVNSVSVHAAARAFRARDVGHWEPQDGDPNLEKMPPHQARMDGRRRAG